MARPATGQVVERRGARGLTYGLRFRAYGQRHYVTADATTKNDAEVELANILADVRRGLWQPPRPDVVEAPAEIPTFHEFAEEWLAKKEVEGLGERTIEDYRWSLELHLLPNFGHLRLDEISKKGVDDYKTAKVRERQRIEAARAEAEAKGERFLERGLSNGTINKTISKLSSILAQAVDYDIIPANAAAGSSRRLKAAKPRRPYVEVEQLMYLLEAAEPLFSKRGRPILATLAGAGLRIGEALELKWHAVDLERGTLTVGRSKTDAGVRVVDLTPALRDELSAWKEASGHTAPDDLVFCTERGTPHSRTNLRKRLLVRATADANVALERDGLKPIGSIGFHALRRTFASLRFAVGDDPVYTAEQIGHESAMFTMRVYASAVKRQEKLTPADLASFKKAVEWARMGTIHPIGAPETVAADVPDQKKTRRLRRVS